jgi:Ca-activated chloride channel homolog
MKIQSRLIALGICLASIGCLGAAGFGTALMIEPASVLLRVSVTDPLNRYVTDLKKENFKVEEDRVSQKILSFEDSSAPVCVAFVIDSTPALRRELENIRWEIRKLFESGNPADELLLISFEQRDAQVETFTKSGAKAEKSPSFGNLPTITGLQDAAFVAIEELKKRAVLKRAIAIVTDGGAAKVNLGLDIAGPGREPEFQMFSISRGSGPKPGTPFPAVERTAGSSYFLSNFSETGYYVGLIFMEVRNQYILGYISSNTRPDRKVRKITVDLDLPPLVPTFQVKARKTYEIPNR